MAQKHALNREPGVLTPKRPRHLEPEEQSGQEFKGLPLDEEILCSAASSTNSRVDNGIDEGAVDIQLLSWGDVYLDSNPSKAVPIGSDHQAILPEVLCNVVDDAERLMGVCIVPLREEEEEEDSFDDRPPSDDLFSCSCIDTGSADCVRCHVTDARENLRRSLGRETFMGLGFDDMGEDVSERWSGDDERLFEKTVFSDPVSSVGPSLWKVLENLFPEKSKAEIVGYYFNVFVLRLRARQNRAVGAACADSDCDCAGSADDEFVLWDGPPVFPDAGDVSVLDAFGGGAAGGSCRFHNACAFCCEEFDFLPMVGGVLGDGGRD